MSNENVNPYTRRDFLTHFGIYLAATGTGCLGSNTASAYGSFQSCALSASQGGVLGRGAFKETDDLKINRFFSRAVTQLQRATGFEPNFAFMREQSGGNAFAVNVDVVDHTHRDGAVLFGINLLNQILDWPAEKKPADNYAAVLAILAHEWAHIAQFAYRKIRPTAKPMELMADFIAGWHVTRNYQNGSSLLGGNSQPHPRGAMTVITSLGDTSFNSPHHHGTSRERLEAYVLGTKFRTHDFDRVMERGYFLYG